MQTTHEAELFQEGDVIRMSHPKLGNISNVRKSDWIVVEAGRDEKGWRLLLRILFGQYRPEHETVVKYQDCEDESLRLEEVEKIGTREKVVLFLAPREIATIGYESTWKEAPRHGCPLCGSLFCKGRCF